MACRVAGHHQLAYNRIKMPDMGTESTKKSGLWYEMMEPTVWEGRMSAHLNMKRSAPSRRAMTAQSDRKMVRPRCEGREMRAKMTPRTIAFRRSAKIDCVVAKHWMSTSRSGILRCLTMRIPSESVHHEHKFIWVSTVAEIEPV